MRFRFNLLKIALGLTSRYMAVVIDRENPPIEGDTITVAGLRAEFKRI